jgi:hypothetical protein
MGSTGMCDYLQKIVPPFEASVLNIGDYLK